MRTSDNLVLSWLARTSVVTVAGQLGFYVDLGRDRLGGKPEALLEGEG